ncbi:hypothetical protein JCM10908_006268 [Rhodotorula pacifica]|uniref:uncharacterized protein n=1 Tax=Rhodotorula pacifica TaxID=1495444 RepID=UPI003174CF5F
MDTDTAASFDTASATAGPIHPSMPPFAPFSLLPDELILLITRHLQRTFGKATLVSFASVSRRIRRLAWPVRLEGFYLTVYCIPTPWMQEMLASRGHLVQDLTAVVLDVGWSSSQPVVEQFRRLDTVLQHCTQLSNLYLLLRPRTGGRDGAPPCFRTLSQHASNLRKFRLDMNLDFFGKVEGLAEVLTAATSLEELDIPLPYQPFSGAMWWNRAVSKIPSLPHLRAVINALLPSARCISPTTFADYTACKSLTLEHLAENDLLHLAACLGHSLESLTIKTLAMSVGHGEPAFFRALRQLEICDERMHGRVLLPALVDLATPLETLELHRISDNIFVGIQHFVESQPCPTLKHVSIACDQPPSEVDATQFIYSVEFLDALEKEEAEADKVASYRLVEQARVWASTRGITINAEWYRPGVTAGNA